MAVLSSLTIFLLFVCLAISFLPTIHSLASAATPTPPAKTMGDDLNAMDQTGRCTCGAVEFRAKGKIVFNQLCHCRACSWAASATPVHIIGCGMPKLEYTKGEDKVEVKKGLGRMIHGRCSECGTQIYQKPSHIDSMVALFPTTFHIGGDDSIYQKLPVKFHPTIHVQYENRAMDVQDALPKFMTNPGAGGNEVNNDGTMK